MLETWRSDAPTQFLPSLVVLLKPESQLQVKFPAVVLMQSELPPHGFTRHGFDAVGHTGPNTLVFIETQLQNPTRGVVKWKMVLCVFIVVDLRKHQTS